MQIENRAIIKRFYISGHWEGWGDDYWIDAYGFDMVHNGVVFDTENGKVFLAEVAFVGNKRFSNIFNKCE